MEVLKERSGGLLSSHILKFPVVLLETMLKEVDPKLLTFPFHLKTGTDVFTPYRVRPKGLQRGLRVWNRPGPPQGVDGPLVPQLVQPK